MERLSAVCHLWGHGETLPSEQAVHCVFGLSRGLCGNHCHVVDYCPDRRRRWWWRHRSLGQVRYSFHEMLNLEGRSILLLCRSSVSHRINSVIWVSMNNYQWKTHKCTSIGFSPQLQVRQQRAALDSTLLSNKLYYIWKENDQVMHWYVILVTWEGILTYHSKNSTGRNHKINDG